MRTRGWRELPPLRSSTSPRMRQTKDRSRYKYKCKCKSHWQHEGFRVVRIPLVLRLPDTKVPDPSVTCLPGPTQAEKSSTMTIHYEYSHSPAIKHRPWFRGIRVSPLVLGGSHRREVSYESVHGADKRPPTTDDIHRLARQPTVRSWYLLPSPMARRSQFTKM